MSNNENSLVYILTQEINEEYNKKFYNLGLYKSLELANKKLEEEINHDVEFGNLTLSNRNKLSANLNGGWLSIEYRIDAQHLK
ncbi:MAG TPA: hypothetical protein VK068_03845 [Jeotgalicoccus sp.]|nr:hypothetical protein [Jeotgalicoccus sp.]